MCIVHSTLRDATTPYTERCMPLKLSNHLLLLIDIWSAEILLHQLYKVCH